MQTSRPAPSSVLGKRPHHHQDPPLSSSPTKLSDQLQTPDPTPNPKRARTSITLQDGDANKENVPPLNTELDSSPSTARATRVLRRNATEAAVTPSRTRTATIRRASTSRVPPATPTSEMSDLAIATPPPTPPTSLLPVHARARGLLRPTCNSTESQIAGRDAERTAILEFLTSFVTPSDSEDEDKTSLYISGSPGTGKTALVSSVLRTLGSGSVNVVFINCMALTSVDALWERLLEELEGAKKRKTAGRAKKSSGRGAVEAALSGLRTKYIFVLDELDHIASAPHPLASIFSLPTSTPSNIRLIGIANTHTLTSSSTSSTFSSSTHVRTLHFAPYTPTQLLLILQSRLSPLHDSDATAEGPTKGEAKRFLPPPTLMLLTKKVAALTGDVRSLFEVLRGAIDLAVSTPVKSGADDNPLNTPSTSVTPAHILAALKAYTPSSASATKTSSTASSSQKVSNSEIVTKVRNLGLQARLVLLSVLLASKRSEAGLSLSSSSSTLLMGTPRKVPSTPSKRGSSIHPSTPSSATAMGIDVSQLHAYYSAVLTRGDSGMFDPVSRSEFGDLVGVLEGVGLLSTSSSLMPSTPGTKTKRAFGRTSSFGPGAGKGIGSAGGDIKLAEGVWGDEVLRGLGVAVSGESETTDVREEEVRAIWEREKGRLAREVRALAKASTSKSRELPGFDEAMED